MITIVDYGMGNLGSVLNMFKYIGADAIISSDLEKIAMADKLLLPGVGAFDAAMYRINESGLRDILEYKAMKERIPVLGICLGMQLITEFSEEGVLPGLGWIKGGASKFPCMPNLKVPHMGWNVVSSIRPSDLTANISEEARFYFVHSYYVKIANEADSILKSTHGIKFDSAIQHNNIYGAQFHPEKSHKFGMNFFRNFASL